MPGHGRRTDDHALPAALDGARGLLGLAGKAERGGGPLPSPLPLPRMPLHHDLMRSNLNGGQRANGAAKRIHRQCYVFLAEERGT